MSRHPNDLTSIVIVRCPEGYEAIVRFIDPRQDLIIRHAEYESIHWMIEMRLDRNIYWGKRSVSKQRGKHERVRQAAVV